jgi:hypothetical protein
MVKEKSNNQNKLSKDGYLIIPNYFFRKWIRILGAGPAILYLELLTYCHKEKDIAWPTINSLCQKMGVSKNSLIKYREVLLTYGLIKKMIRRKSIGGDYQVNLYQLTSLEGANIEPGVVQKLHQGGAKNEPGIVQILNPNNNNTKHYQVNNNKEVGKDTAVVDFNKLEKDPPAKAGEKGDLSACLPDLSACNAQAERGRSQSGNAQAEEKMQAIIEQLADLSFEERFIEQILKDFSLKKIEEKLELLMAKRNIQNPAGWLRAALKYDYQSSEPEEREEERKKVDYKKVNRKKDASSREKALEMIRKTREMLANLQKKEEMCNGIKRINC